MIGRHYHIITCDDIETLKKFIEIGKVGIRPVVSKAKKENEQVSRSVRMNWDILADMARVKKGDYVILHAKGAVQGIFEVIEDPLVEEKFAHLFSCHRIEVENWRGKWNLVKSIAIKKSYVWWIPIKPVKGLLFSKMDMAVIFREIAEGKLPSLPLRLRYEDKNKTIKGITRRDFEEIVYLFMNYSSPLSDLPANTCPRRNYVKLDFNYLTKNSYEKNIEAVLISRVRNGSLQIKDESQQLYFPHTNILNTVPVGYLKMADMLTWSEWRNRIVNPWIWELKTVKINSTIDKFSKDGSISSEGLFGLIQRLNGRAEFLNKFFLHSDTNFKITGVVVAKDFSRDVVDKFKNLICPIGVLEEVYLISYSGLRKNVDFKVVAKI